MQVYRREDEGSGAWREDEAWTAGLDEAWSVEAVREASYRALAEVGKESMHFRPPEEQNAHKVCISLVSPVGAFGCLA